MLLPYARFIVRHSYLFLFIIVVISTILTVIPLVCRDLPSFSEPLVGFETRGTTLAHRFIAWENLIDETRPSRQLAVNPKEIEDQIRMKESYNNRNKTRSAWKNPKKHHKNTTTKHGQWVYGKVVTFEDENAVFLKNHSIKQWKTNKDMLRTSKKNFDYNYAFGKCGAPVADYAHLVVTSSDNMSMLSFENVQKLCHLQNLLTKLDEDNYQNLCQRSEKIKKICCPVWSASNYITLISGKDSCEHLTEDDVTYVVKLLKKCAAYFYNFSLVASCENRQCQVPKYCSQYNAIYNLLFYIIDSEAFSPPKFSEIFVKYVMIFLPLPTSSTILPYYLKLQGSNIIQYIKPLTIPAMDFGLKNVFFDLCIIKDTWLIGLGGLFVFMCVWIYAKSIILTISLFIAITYSLGVAYFIYIYVFDLGFFPFMNLLVVVIVIGIGADDAFLYVKVWKMISKRLLRDNVVSEDNDLTAATNISTAGEILLVQIFEEVLQHSVVAIFVTTLTTAVAFYASYVSYIPAINCFSVFAGTAVLVNFVLMVTWLPVTVFIIEVLHVKLSASKPKMLISIIKSFNRIGRGVSVILNNFIITCVMRLQTVFVVIFGAIGLCSIVIVCFYPGLQFPDSKQFQLFHQLHPFEQYDLYYRDKFIFEKLNNGIGNKMPLRWVWGIKAIDNGNHMDPFSKGKLIFDDDFSISNPKSQLWLLDFCTKVKSQPFYQQTLGPLLSNCFIESFKLYMSRRCIDNIDKVNRTPCCESSHFPYTEEVFDLCIVNAMESLYQTPMEIFMPGVAGPKFLRSAYPPSVSAIVIEFESVIPYSMSYKAMYDLYYQVENWTKEQLKTAPAGLKHGWFVSDLQFFDLQSTLASGTLMALLLSAALGFLVLIPSTYNLIVSVCSLLAIVFSATVTIAVLVLNDWKLNILESVAISTSAGLAVDFNLHYALSYTLASGIKTTRVKFALSTSSGPTAAAALTTGFAGIFLLHSSLLPYSQIGTFLALIMSVSWVYATFFLCPLLLLVGGPSKEVSTEHRKSISRVSSICSVVPNLENHELENLAGSNRTIISPTSPTSISATTVVIHEDFENSLRKINKSPSIDVNND